MSFSIVSRGIGEGMTIPVTPLAYSGGTNKVQVDVRIISSTGRNIEAEIAAGSWYVLGLNEEIVLRRDTSGLWDELVAKASGARTTIDGATRVADAATPTVATR